MPLTHELIATSTVTTSGVSTFDFTNIPATYDDLVLYISARGVDAFDVGARAMFWRFNNSGANRTSRRWYMTGGSVSGNDGPGGIMGIIPGASSTTDVFGFNKMYICDYTSSGRKVSIQDSFASSLPSNNNLEFDWMGAYWDDSSIINRITINIGDGTGGNFALYSTASLYGIKKQ